MSLDPSVQFQALKAFASTPKTRFQRALITFVPTGGLVAGFTELTLAVTQTNWKLLLRARGGTPDDLLWKAVAAYWAPAGASVGTTGQNPAKAKHFSDRLILGRRTNASPTKWTITITGGTDGAYVLGAAGYTGKAILNAVGQTAAQIATAAITAWNLVPDLALDSTASSGGAGVVTVETDTDGFPFIVTGSSTGSAITIEKSTVGGDYAADLDAILADTNVANDPLRIGDFWAIHDLQLDDVTNRQGVQWCIEQKTTDARRSFCYFGEAYQATIPDAAVVVDEATTLKTLLTPYADENNDRGAGLFFVQSIDFAVCTWLGRCIGYNLGAINFAQRELVSIPTVDLEDEVVATLKYFNFYSPESPKGNTKWGYLGSGRYIDDLWGEDILTWEGQTALLGLLVGADALGYTDQRGIAQGKSAITQALIKYQTPAYGYIISDSIEVLAGKRAAQPSDDITNRKFVDYQVSVMPAELINRFGDAARPIILTISV